MTTKLLLLCALAAAGALHTRSEAAVRLTALQIISTDAGGKIPGVGAHRFLTSNHGGQPCIFLVEGKDLNGPILNGPGPAQNSVDFPMAAGTHTYTIYAERYNSYTWNYYTLDLHFDQSNTAQISGLTMLNSSSTQFFPPTSANSEFTYVLSGGTSQAPGTLVYKSGTTEVTLVSFHFAAPALYSKDRVSPFEAKSDNTLDYVGQFTLEVKAPPEISAGGVVNGASFAPKVAAGSLFSIFGTSLALENRAAEGTPLPRSLGQTSVTIGGKSAPLIYVSANQINAQVPYEVLEAQTVPVVVTVNGVASAPVNVAVAGSAPGIFQFGERRAVVQNQDYSTNTAENGASVDSYVVVYLTGAGKVDNAVPTGMPAKTEPLSRAVGRVTATVNGTAAEVAFAGLTPDFTGLTQVNLKVPSLASGTYPLAISVDGEKSNAPLITVR